MIGVSLTEDVRQGAADPGAGLGLRDLLTQHGAHRVLEGGHDQRDGVGQGAVEVEEDHGVTRTGVMTGRGSSLRQGHAGRSGERSLYLPANSWPDICWMALMISSVACRRARPAGMAWNRPVKSSGAPNSTRTLARVGSREPTGCNWSVPRNATGTTGQPAVSANQATPVRPRYSRPSRERVPSG